MKVSAVGTFILVPFLSRALTNRTTFCKGVEVGLMVHGDWVGKLRFQAQGHTEDCSLWAGAFTGHEYGYPPLNDDSQGPNSVPSFGCACATVC